MDTVKIWLQSIVKRLRFSQAPICPDRWSSRNMMTALIISDNCELAQRMVSTFCEHCVPTCDLKCLFVRSAVFNFNAYPALFVFEDGKHKKYTGGREAKDIVMYMTAVSKGLDPHDEEAKLKPGLYKGAAMQIKSLTSC